MVNGKERSIKINIKAPVKKEKQLMAILPYLSQRILPSTPYKAKDIADNSANITPRRSAAIWKGFNINIIPSTLTSMDIPIVRFTFSFNNK